MITDKILMLIVVIHFLADFALQTHDQAINKSKSWKWLLYHTLTYSSIWFIVVLPILTTDDAIFFFWITLTAHTLTDAITSRIGKPFWDRNDYHNGFVVIGFDQMLHYLQLYLTFKLLL